MISGPPSDFWSPSFLLHLSRQAASAHFYRRIKPRRFPPLTKKVDSDPFEGPAVSHRNESNLTISSTVLSSISGSMLMIPPETRCENGNPALRRRPANSDVIHFAQPHSFSLGSVKGGWGDGDAHITKVHSDWTDFVSGGGASLLSLLLIGLSCYQGFSWWLPQTTRQLDKDAVAILKRDTLRQNQSSA